MRTTVFFLINLILSVGFVYAQGELPTPSEDDGGPWYYIKVKGGDEGRNDRMLISGINADNPDFVFGRKKSSEYWNEVDKFLWRFVEAEEGTYRIINKFAGKELGIAERETTSEKIEIASLLDEPLTTWSITPNENDNNYFAIHANDPLTADKVYLHQGAGGDRDYVIMMEVSDWGQGEDSQYQFIEYVDERIYMNTNTLKIEGPENLEKAIGSVFVKKTEGAGDTPITLYLLGEDADAGYLIENEDGSFDAQNGGEIKISFKPNPEEVRFYTATLFVTCGEISLMVDVTARSVAALPKFSNENIEHWYGIRFVISPDSLMQDNGVDNQITMENPVQGSEAQQWKFVGTKEKFNLVSRLGNSYTLIPTTNRGTVTATGTPTDFEVRYYEKSSADGELLPYGDLQIYISAWKSSSSASTYGYVFFENRVMASDETGIPRNFMSYHYYYYAGTKVDPVFIETVGEESGVDIIDANDPVVSKSYYTLQGIQVPQPIEGFYILKKMHASQKISVEKIYKKK